MPPSSSIPPFETLVADYRNTAEHNDELHRRMTACTWGDAVLAEHRRHIEKHQLGFGDAAFHALWASLLAAASRRFGTVRALEIGVFKGQVISLWSLIARQHQLELKISAISPLAAQPMPRSRLWARLRYRLDRRFRERVDNGDFYARTDYPAIVRELFAHCGTRFTDVKLHRGYSTDPAILAAVGGETYHLIYVDGDHTFAGARRDFENFGPKVAPGGWLVADDAGCDLPGNSFWKGHTAVTRAVQVLPSLGFKNVLNVGHNRVYERSR